MAICCGFTHFWLQNSSLHVGLQHLPPRRRRRRLLAHRGPDVGTAGRRGARVEAKWREDGGRSPWRTRKCLGKMRKTWEKWREHGEYLGKVVGKCRKSWKNVGKMLKKWERPRENANTWEFTRGSDYCFFPGGLT